MTKNLVRFLFLAAVNHQITVIVTESLLFKPLRREVKKRSHYLGELVSCHLCFGTWVGFFLAIVYRPRLLEQPRLFERRQGLWDHAASFLVDSFAIAMGGRLFNEVLGLLKREVAKAEEEKELISVEKERRAQGAPSAPPTPEIVRPRAL